MARAFDTPITTNDLSLDRVLEAGLPVVLLFFDGSLPAELERTMERLAREYSGQVLVARIPVKDNPASVQRFQVSRTPEIVTLRDGKTISQAPTVTSEVFQQHLLFLLGKGPKPEARVPSAPSAQAAPNPASGRPLTVTDATFDQTVLRSSQPVVVDFWAPWCGPCRMVEPTVEKLAGEYAGRVSFVKMNVDENPSISERYGIRSIPTMMVVKHGQIVDRWAGALPEPALRSRVEPQLRS